MRHYLIIAITFVTNTQGFTQTISPLEKNIQAITKDLMLNLETEIITQRDKKRDYEITGYEELYIAETGYNINKKNRLTLGAEYTIREFADVQKEDKNRDHLSQVYANYLFKAAKYAENDLMDLRISPRLYSNEDPLFQQKFGNNGNYQIRANFGRPLIGRFSLNPFTTYIRYKKYFLNQYANEHTRDYELRARMTPSYSLIDGVDLGLTFTYNHIFEQMSDNENLEIGPSIRYQIDQFAILLRANYEYLQTNDTGELAYNKNAPKNIGYALNLSARIF